MSLATELTQCQGTIMDAERAASARLRGLKGMVPPEIYSELQVQLIIIASEATRLKVCLGSLRMIGALEQRPAPVTVESLELAAFCGRSDHGLAPAATERDFEHFKRDLAVIGDDTFADEPAEAGTTDEGATRSAAQGTVRTTLTEGHES